MTNEITAPITLDSIIITAPITLGGSTYVGTNTIQTQSEDIVLTESDLNTIHICTAAAQLTLPEITNSMIGKWIRLKKNTTETVSYLTAGSDTIEGDTTITNSTTDLADFIDLIAESLTNWGAYAARGTWVGA